MVCTDEASETKSPSRFLFTRELDPRGHATLSGHHERALFRCEHACFAYGDYEFVSLRRNTPELGGLVIRRFKTPLEAL